MSELVGEAIVELRGDDKRLRSDIRRAGKEAGSSFGDSFDKENRKRIGSSFRSSMLDAAKRTATVLNVAGIVGPAILAIGSAASAAVAGVTAIGAALGPAAVGGAAAFAGALLAVKTGIGGVKLAFGNLDKALAGNAKALASLSPPAKTFLTTLKGLKPRVEGIRTAVQNGLFPHLATDATRLANRYLPAVKSAAGALGSQLGRLADQGTKMVTSGPWRRDFATVARANTRNVGLFGRAGLQLADALRSLFVTAQPLIHTFAKFALSAATQVNAFIQAKRASGDLAKFWSLASTSGAQLGRILGNVAVGLGHIFAIGGGGQGKVMLSNLEGISAQFRAWTTSSNGIRSITTFFDNGRRNLGAMGRLLGATTVGLSKLGSGQQLAPLVDQIRQQLLPPLLAFLKNASDSGALSQLISALASLARVFADLAGQNSSLLAFTTTLKAVGDAAAWVLEHVPGATQALSALFVVLGARAALGVVGLGGAVSAAGATFGILADRAAVSTGILAANTGAVGANTLAYRLSRSTLGTWVGIKALEARAWFASTAAARVSSAVVGSTAGKLGLAAVGIAGVAASAHSSSKALGALGGAASGAIAGAALGSFIPGAGTAVGAIVGGLAGMTIGFIKAGNGAKKAGEDARSSVPSWQALAATLDQATGAITANTRAQVFDDLSKKGLLATTRSLGLSDRQAINAITSQGVARKNLSSIVADQINVLKGGIGIQDRLAKSPNIGIAKEAQARATLLRGQLKNYQALLAEMGIVPKAIEQTRRRAQVTQIFGKEINKLPRQLVLQLRQNGLERTRGALVEIQRQYHLTPKQLALLIREQGGTPTKRQIQSIIADAKLLDRQHPHVKVTADTGQARNEIASFIHSQSGRQINLTVTAHNNKARAAGGPVAAGQTYLVGERGPELVTFDRAAFVHNAADTARLLASGGRNTKVTKQAKQQGSALLAALAAGVREGAPKVITALQQLQAQAGKLHLSKVTTNEVAALLKGYGDAATKIKDLRDQIATFRTDFTNTFTTSVGLVGGDATDILANYGFQAGRTTQFLRGLAQLAKAGLNKTLVAGLQGTGVDALPQVQALLDGGPGTIAALNAQTVALNKAAATAGATVSNTMFGNGKQMAASLIAGLQSQQAALVRQMEALAAAMIRAIRGRRGLRMHSPSVPLVAVGAMAGRSVALGVRGQEQSVAQAAQLLAAAAIRGTSSLGLAPSPRPITTSAGTVPGLGAAPSMTANIHLPTGDPEAAAQAVWTRWVAAVVTG